MGIPIGPTRDPGLIGDLAQFAARRELQERHDQRPVERDHRAFGTAFLPCGAGRGNHEIRQALKILLRDGHEPFPFIPKHILAELGAQHRQP